MVLFINHDAALVVRPVSSHNHYHHSHPSLSDLIVLTWSSSPPLLKQPLLSTNTPPHPLSECSLTQLRTPCRPSRTSLRKLKDLLGLYSNFPPRRLPKTIVPGLVVVGAAYSVASYIRSQLRYESTVMNARFAQQNTPNVVASRNRSLLVETEGDPRKTIYNVLNW